MDDEFLIHLEIAEKDYGLRIKRSDEEITRAAAKQIRDKIDQYRKRYSQTAVDVKDLLAMVALQLSVANLQLEQKNDTGPFEEKIQQLGKELEEYLK